MAQVSPVQNGPYVFSCFLSDLLGKKIYSPSGRYMGRFSDIVARIDERYPEIQGLVFKAGKQQSCVSIESIDLRQASHAKRVTLERDDPRRFQPGDRHFFVKEILYDRQIVDVNGAKVERVNDVLILSRGYRYYLAKVDVGFSGLVRRLGFEKGVRGFLKAIGKDLQDELIAWKFVQPLPEASTSPVSVSLRQDELKLLHAGELADILEELDRDERIDLVESIGAEDAAEALQEADIDVQASILRDLNVEFAADILEEMEPAVAADVIDRLPAEARISIMEAMEDEERGQIQILIHAKEDSAASLMTVDFLSCLDSQTASEVFTLLKEYVDEVDSITYIYCTDDEMHLTGVISLRELILADPETPMGDIMNRRLVSLKLDDTWEVIANQFHKLRFKALPVVDADGRILGIVTFLHSFDELLPFYHKLAS